jgi:hypothetical protein
MEFLKKTGFFDFGMFADEYTVRQYFLLCRKVVFCDGVFFLPTGQSRRNYKENKSEAFGCPLCQGSCPLLYFYSISQVGGIGR